MRWLVLFGVWAIYFSFGVAIASMAPMVAEIAGEIGASNTAMGAILGAWPLTYIAAAIPAGMLLDKFGARPMLLVAAILMAGSLALRSLADTPWQMLGAVAVFGLGGPLISVGAPKTIARLFTGKTRATAMGVYVTGPYLGGILALAATNSVALPLAGGDWRGVMLIYAGLVLTAGLVWTLIASLPGYRTGAGGEDAGKKFDLAAFAEILRVPSVRLILAMAVAVFFFNHALNNWLPELLRARGFSAVEAGYWAAVPSALGILGVLVIPRFATPERRLAVMTALFLAALAASVLLQVAAVPGLAAGLVLQGIARGSLMTVAMLLLMETPDVPPDRLGLAGGMFFTSAEVGGVLGPLSFGILLDLSGGFVLPLAAVSAACVAGLAICARLRSRAAS